MRKAGHEPDRVTYELWAQLQFPSEQIAEAVTCERQRRACLGDYKGASAPIWALVNPWTGEIE